MKTKLFQMEVDAELIDYVTQLYDDLGISVDIAILMFLKKSREENGLPFELRKSDRNLAVKRDIKELSKNIPIKHVDWNDPESVKEILDGWE
jgi:addiction module RelB/DinJ family antitoxin